MRIIATKQRVCVFLDGEIDHHTAAPIRMEIDEVLQRNQPKYLELDFSDVNFMDSSGVGLVMGRYRTAMTFGGKIRVVNLSKQMYKMMCMAGLNKLADLSQKEEVQYASGK